MCYRDARGGESIEGCMRPPDAYELALFAACVAFGWLVARLRR